MMKSNTKGMAATDVSYHPRGMMESNTTGMATPDVSYHPPERYGGDARVLLHQTSSEKY
jgi:hypothetical protein